jgi:ribosomal protein S18 acetylase RimI-like enzyme
MLFCSQELAARIEHAEAQLLAAACVVVGPRLPGMLARPVGDGFAAFTEPDSPLNKVAGLGFGAPFDSVAWGEVEAAYAERHAPVQVEIATLADPSIAAFLSARGYQLVGVENVLGIPLPAAAALPHSEEVQVEVSAPADLRRWLEVIVTGFASADAQGVQAHEEFDRSVLERIIRDFAQAAGVVRYLAMRGGEAVGAGSMRLGDGIAQLCGAATLPAHRRRGVQTALLAQRLTEAAQRGCSLAVVTTQPGSKSQENVQRQGFSLLYSRNVLRREPS